MHQIPWGGPLAWLLIVTTSVATTAQPASDEDVVMRTSEIPGVGVAITLPVEWRIWSFTDDKAHGIYASDVSGRRTCVFRLLSEASSAAAMAEETVEAVSRHKTEVQQATHDVPVGTAVRVSYRYESLPDEPRFVQHEYHLDVPRGVVSVYCAGDEPPADRWLSIVESITPLPAELPTSAPFDPRVEVPEHGLAVDFPAEWLVRSWPGPGPVLGGSVVLRAVTLAQEDGPGGHECLIEDDTALPSLPDVASLDEWLDTLVSTAGAQERTTSEPVVTQVDLPSGPTVGADWERWSGMPATAWILADGDRRAALFCRSDEPPEDRWLSVAESFEFLPAEE